MTASNNEHFRQYLYKNYIEEKDLKITLSKLDEEKCEKLGEFRRRKYNFVARHSRHMISSDSTKHLNRLKCPSDSKGVNNDRHIQTSYKNDIKDSTRNSVNGTMIRRERTTTVSSIQQQSQLKPETDGQTTEDVLKLPPLFDRKSKTKIESYQSLTDDHIKLQDNPRENEEKCVSLETAVSKTTKQLNRCRSERNLKNLAIPISKIHLFRQLSHRVSRMSTWYYLLRDVFERLSNNEELEQNGDRQGKSAKELFEELKTCRYLRMPPLHRITPTYASSEFTE